MQGGAEPVEDYAIWIPERPPFPSSLQNRRAQVQFRLGIMFQWSHLQPFFSFQFPPAAHLWPPSAPTDTCYSAWGEFLRSCSSCSESRRSSSSSAAFWSTAGACTSAHIGSPRSALHLSNWDLEPLNSRGRHRSPQSFPQTETNVKEENSWDPCFAEFMETSRVSGVWV